MSENNENKQWKCICGQMNSSPFCINCGKKKEDGQDPVPSVAASTMAAAAAVTMTAEDKIPQPQVQPQAQPQVQQPYQPVQQQPYQQPYQPMQQQPYQPVQQPVQPQMQQYQPMQQPVQQYQPVQNPYQQYQPQYQQQRAAYSMPLNEKSEEEQNRMKKVSNRLSIISLILHYGGAILITTISAVYSGMSGTDLGDAAGSLVSILSSLMGATYIASIVLMIVARIKCKKAIFAKVLMWLYIAEAIICFILLIVAFVAFLELLSTCSA